jgi:hypothetical protein
MSHIDDPTAHYRSQRSALATLTTLLDSGEQAGLPPLSWTITDNGMLNGEAVGITYTPDEQSAAVHDWATHLDYDVDESLHFGTPRPHRNASGN